MHVKRGDDYGEFEVLLGRIKYLRWYNIKFVFTHQLKFLGQEVI